MVDNKEHVQTEATTKEYFDENHETDCHLQFSFLLLFICLC